MSGTLVIHTVSGMVDHMSSQAVFWFRCGAILAGLAVVTGAFAAHGLEEPLLKMYGSQTKQVLGKEIPAAEKYLGDFKTAAEYQMSHGLALLALALLPGAWTKMRSLAAWSFLLGILLFSGSLYALVLTGQTKLGMITPFGGLLFLVGWGALARGAAKRE